MAILAQPRRDKARFARYVIVFVAVMTGSIVLWLMDVTAW